MNRAGWTYHKGGIKSRLNERTGERVYYARFTLADGRRKVQRVGLTLKTARRRLAELRNAVIAGKYMDPREERGRLAEERKRLEEERARRVSFRDLVARFLKDYQPRSGHTHYYRDQSVIWLRHFRERIAEEITPADVRAMLTGRLKEEKVGPSTARKNVISLCTLFRWAVMEGILDSNPADSTQVKRPSEPASTSRALTDEGYKHLHGVCPAWLATLVKWACATGMDKGQAITLRWNDLELQRDGTRIVSGSFKVLRGKTGKPVRQVLNSEAVAALNEAQRVRHTTGVIFLDDKGQPMALRALDWVVEKAVKAAELPSVSFRTFRHTFATRALRAGVHPRVVAQMMGHSTAFITERYMHVADDMLERAAEAMSSGQQAEAVVASGAPGTDAATRAATRPTATRAEDVLAPVSLSVSTRRGTEVVVTGAPRKRLGG